MAWIKGTVIVAALLALLPAAAVVAGQMGWWRGSPPTRLGVVDGKLRPPSPFRNSVSSQADLWPEEPGRAYARIAPLAAGTAPGAADAAWAKLRATLAAWPGARIEKAEGDYLYVQFTTRWLGFVDDAEFWLDRGAGVIHVRSASRLGKSDLGVNRARIETLRARLAAPAAPA
jgi:uncharacterized protein (DUF1499 family)